MSERNEAKRDGARLHKNSGRNTIKGDASTDDLVIDYKEASKSFTLNLKVWGKVCTDTMKVDPHKNPALKVILGDKHKTRLAVIEWEYLEELLNGS